MSPTPTLAYLAEYRFGMPSESTWLATTHIGVSERMFTHHMLASCARRFQEMAAPNRSPMNEGWSVSSCLACCVRV